MPVRGRQIAIGLALVVGAYVVIQVAVGFHQTEAKGSAMVAVGKAAGLIDRRLPENCARIGVSTVDGSWGDVDQPAWSQTSGRCWRYSRKLLIVFHRVRGRFQVVTTRTSFGRYGGCTVAGVPRAVSESMPVC